MRQPLRMSIADSVFACNIYMDENGVLKAALRNQSHAGL